MKILKLRINNSVANPCENNPCEHGGTCVFDHEHPPNYTCICKPRYEGIHCDIGKIITMNIFFLFKRAI